MKTLDKIMGNFQREGDFIYFQPWSLKFLDAIVILYVIIVSNISRLFLLKKVSFCFPDLVVQRDFHVLESRFKRNTGAMSQLNLCKCRMLLFVLRL